MFNFGFNDEIAYQTWRETKLEAIKHASYTEAQVISDPKKLSIDELQNIKLRCKSNNFIFFELSNASCDPTTLLKNMADQLGLININQNLCAENSGLTELTTKTTATNKQYIPYTNKPLSWHTDGYYNSSHNQIHGWLLYCAQDADKGGENEILDQDIAYIHLRDTNPDFVRALMHPNAITIPANENEVNGTRDQVSGPVFTVNHNSSSLHMRYSARKRNIIWPQDDTTQSALACLSEICSPGTPGVVRHRLSPGEGIISNNILHRREGFTDDEEKGKKRLIYRARYFNRII